MKKILILSLLISCLQFFMSCENWFDVNPKSQVKNDILFENENGYKTALFGIYTTMATPALYGQELTMSLLDVLAQYYTINDNYHNFYNASIYNYEASTVKSKFDAIWKTMYKTIMNCNNLLENMEGTKVGVIQNELGKISIDGTVLQNNDIQMIELNRGSIFCSCLRLSFVDALTQMAQKGLEYVFVESSGFGDPSNAEEILAATEVMAPGAYDFRGCICLVDCYNFLDQIGDSETIDRQLKHCNLAVLTKVDLVDSEQIEQVKDKVREINPVCPITESANGNIDRSFYDMDLMLYKWAECEDTTNSSKNKPKTFSMDFTGEIQKEKLEAFLARIEPDVFRVKGFFKVEKEGWEKVDVVGKKRDYAPYEPQPKSQLVFISKIGIALIREIAAAWEECVGLPMKLNN